MSRQASAAVAKKALHDADEEDAAMAEISKEKLAAAVAAWQVATKAFEDALLAAKAADMALKMKDSTEAAVLAAWEEAEACEAFIDD